MISRWGKSIRNLQSRDACYSEGRNHALHNTRCRGERRTCLGDGRLWAAIILKENGRLDVDVGGEDLGDEVCQVAFLQLLDSTGLVSDTQKG